MGISRVNVGGTPVHSVVFLGHNILKIDKTLDEWRKKQNEFMDGEITHEEYEDWKANWPDSLEDDYVFDRQEGKETSFQEYIDKVQAFDDAQARRERLAERRYRLAEKKAKKGKK